MSVRIVTYLALLMMSSPANGDPKPVPTSKYLPLVYRYADTMLKHGRDTYGPQKSGLLLSALDRTDLKPLHDHAFANPQHDQNLLRVLYTLSELSGKPVYREAADDELKWILRNPSSSQPRVPPWEQEIAWNVMADAPVARDGIAAMSSRRPWTLWHRCFALDVESSKKLLLGLRDVSARGPFPLREAGFAIRAFSVAYQHAKDEAYLKSIDVVLGHLEAARGQSLSHDARLSAAIDCGGAATRVPEPMAMRLRTFAARQDQAFCALPHDLKRAGGFVIAPGEPAERSSGNLALTPLWRTREDGRTTALLAMMCVSRYENTGDVRYRELIAAAADAYQRASPPDDADVWPLTFGQAISLQLAAWRSSARQEYLDHAVKLANHAVELFWQDNPLPRGSAMSQHYESARGTDTLVLALVELHLSILHITAVRCPPNTIDR